MKNSSIWVILNLHFHTSTSKMVNLLEFSLRLEEWFRVFSRKISHSSDTDTVCFICIVLILIYSSSADPSFESIGIYTNSLAAIQNGSILTAIDGLPLVLGENRVNSFRHSTPLYYTQVRSIIPNGLSLIQGDFYEACPDPSMANSRLTYYLHCLLSQCICSSHRMSNLFSSHWRNQLLHTER